MSKTNAPLYVALASDSELVTLARGMGHRHASRATPRPVLEALVSGEPVDLVDAIADIRSVSHEQVMDPRVQASFLICDRDCVNCNVDLALTCWAVNNFDTEREIP
jgi:hypothetical protein